MISRVIELKVAIRQVCFSVDYVNTCKARKSACPVTAVVEDAGFWFRLEGWCDILKPAYLFLKAVDTNAPALHLVLEQALAIRTL